MPPSKKISPTKNTSKVAVPHPVLSANISLGGISFMQKALFAKNLSVMLRAAIPINVALGIASTQAHGGMRRVIKGLQRSVEEGNTFADSLARYPKVFPDIFVEVVLAGEESGSLDQALENIAVQLEKDYQLVSKVRGAMLYPSVIFIATIGLGLFMAYVILPQLIPLFEGLNVDLPWTTRTLIAVAKFVQDFGIVAVPVSIASLVGVLWLWRQRIAHPFTHFLYLHIPVIGTIVHSANMSRFCRILAALLRSGIVIEQALEICGKTVGNFYYKHAIHRLAREIPKGTKLSDNMRRYPSLFPEMATEMVGVAERSGKLEEILAYLANFYETEADNASKSLATAIEPMMLLLVGGVVAFLALSIITPIFQLTGNIRQ